MMVILVAYACHTLRLCVYAFDLLKPELLSPALQTGGCLCEAVPLKSPETPAE